MFDKWFFNRWHYKRLDYNRELNILAQYLRYRKAMDEFFVTTPGNDDVR